MAIYTKPEYSLEIVRPKHHTGPQHSEYGRGWTAGREDEDVEDIPLPEGTSKDVKRWKDIQGYLVQLRGPFMHWRIVKILDPIKAKTGGLLSIPEKLQGDWTSLSDLELAINAHIGANTSEEQVAVSLKQRKEVTNGKNASGSNN